jgi:hypothetical protein
VSSGGVPPSKHKALHSNPDTSKKGKKKKKKKNKVEGIICKNFKENYNT